MISFKLIEYTRFGDWVLNLALRNNAIIVSPDYRLMPEANGLEILQDLRDFYKWLFTPGNLTASLASGIEPNLENILVSGESAGGWASLQSGILSESKQNVRAIISQYPMIDMRDPHYTAEYEKALFDPPAPQLDHGILRKYMAKMKIGEVITSEIPPSRVPIVISALQQGKWGDWFGGDSSLYPIEMLDKLDIIPPTWILHGKDDNVVPIDGTYKFVGHLKEKQPSARLHTSYRPGGHGFDNHGPASLDEDWLKEGVDFIGQFWPMP